MEHEFLLDFIRKNNSPALQLGKYSLVGFESNTEGVALDENHFIRKVSDEELHEFYHRTSWKNSPEWYLKNKYMFFCFFEAGKYDVFAFQNHQKRILNFLRIYNDSDVWMPWCNSYIEAQNKGEYQSTGFNTFPNEKKSSSHSPMYLQDFEVHTMKNLWKRYSTIDFQKNQFLKVVLNRFNDSLYRIDSSDKLIDLVISFEALLLENESNKTSKLSNRVALLLKEQKDKSSTIRFMRQVYDFRSRIVHGDLETDYSYEPFSNFKIIESYCNTLTSILRLCILEYLNKYHNFSKGEFIRNIR